MISGIIGKMSDRQKSLSVICFDIFSSFSTFILAYFLRFGEVNAELFNEEICI